MGRRLATCVSSSGSPVAAALDLPPDLWPVEADPGQMTQVLNNIILNAVDAMKGKGRLGIATAENAAALRQFRKMSFRRCFLDDDFRLAGFHCSRYLLLRVAVELTHLLGLGAQEIAALRSARVFG